MITSNPKWLQACARMRLFYGARMKCGTCSYIFVFGGGKSTRCPECGNMTWVNGKPTE